MENRKMNLQMFAAGNNNDLSARSYQKEFKQLLQAVFAKQSYFADFFGGSIEAIDGIQENETAFYVKTSDIPVVVGTAYKKDAAVAMGAGTGSTNRFGNRTEVIYTDVPVNYSWEWVFHEGIDRHTVNNDFDAAIADRLELQARAKTATFNSKHSLFISSAAGKFIAGGASITKDTVADIFAQLDAYYTDAEVVGARLAKVNSVVWNAIIDSGLATSSKGSTVNIDNNTIITKSYNQYYLSTTSAASLPRGDPGLF